MPRKRYVVAKLKERGRWHHMSREEQLRRLLLELPETLIPGTPSVPEGVNPRTQKDFLTICADLQGSNKLSTADGPLVLQYIILQRVRNDEESERVAEVFRARRPFALLIA